MPERNEYAGAAAFVPRSSSLAVLREAVATCRGCDLYQHATQAVFGEMEGNSARRHVHAAMMMIGEQPGDREDIEGRPFVGPAGKLLNHCLGEAGIDRRDVYVTNTVKHFRWEPRGKLRLHKKPSMAQIRACRPWLDAELRALEPRLIVCLGAMAAQSLLGPSFRVTANHGIVKHVEGLPAIIATAHPASILRAPTDDDRHRQTAMFVSDLVEASRFLRSLEAPRPAR